MRTNIFTRLTKVAPVAGVAMSLVACSGGGGSPMPASTYTVGGTVSGLTGSGLELQNNGGDTLTAASGAFAFKNALSEGTAYSVTVSRQPSGPAQTCVVGNGSGTVAKANVTNVAVTCTSASFIALANQPPQAGALALLMTDGSVLMQSINDAGVFYNLKPDAAGSYANGSWHQITSPPAGYAPYAGSQVVLADGRVLFVGGEYNQNQYDLPLIRAGSRTCLLFTTPLLIIGR